MSTSETKYTNAGENPYMYVAAQLKIAEELEKQIQIFTHSSRTEKDYQVLIDWEVSNFSKAYLTLYGRNPREGDLESMLPESTATPDAIETLPKLHQMGVRSAVVSSGFKYLVDPAVVKLGIHSDVAFANRFTYDEISGDLNGVEINVSGNKVGALQKAINAFENEGINRNQIAYVGDNNWDFDAIKFILSQGGSVFYLQPEGDESKKMYPLLDTSLFENDHFHVIESLVHLLEQPFVGKEIKAIIYDADGTIIDTSHSSTTNKFLYK